MDAIDSDKHTLHHDAKRLFMEEEGPRAEWNASYDAKYKSGKEAGRHSLRDATAFATVALPAHYSVVYSVLDHVKQRLGPDWEVQHVLDWGAATGSGLWFVHVFLESMWFGDVFSATGLLDTRSNDKPMSTDVLHRTWRISRYLTRVCAAISVSTSGRALCGSGSV